MRTLTETETARFWRYVRNAEGCWLWSGTTDKNGYGLFYVAGERIRAPRLMLMLSGARLPAGMIACHHCDNPPCVNPAHLYVGTCKQNSQDMARRKRHRNQNSAKTHCKRGHEFTPENVRAAPDGGRTCRTCERAKHRRRDAVRNKLPERREQLARASRLRYARNREKIRARERARYRAGKAAA